MFGSPRSHEEIEPNTSSSVDEAQDQVLEPTIQEVHEEVKRMKNNKAPGIDSVTAELLKNGGEIVIKILHILITKIWKSRKTIPTEWKKYIKISRKL